MLVRRYFMGFLCVAAKKGQGEQSARPGVQLLPIRERRITGNVLPGLLCDSRRPY